VSFLSFAEGILNGTWQLGEEESLFVSPQGGSNTSCSSSNPCQLQRAFEILEYNGNHRNCTVDFASGHYFFSGDSVLLDQISCELYLVGSGEVQLHDVTLSVQTRQTSLTGLTFVQSTISSSSTGFTFSHGVLDNSFVVTATYGLFVDVVVKNTSRVAWCDEVRSVISIGLFLVMQNVKFYNIRCDVVSCVYSTWATQDDSIYILDVEFHHSSATDASFLFSYENFEASNLLFHNVTLDKSGDVPDVFLIFAKTNLKIDNLSLVDSEISGDGVLWASMEHMLQNITVVNTRAECCLVCVEGNGYINMTRITMMNCPSIGGFLRGKSLYALDVTISNCTIIEEDTRLGGLFDADVISVMDVKIKNCTINRIVFNEEIEQGDVGVTNMSMIGTQVTTLALSASALRFKGVEIIDSSATYQFLYARTQIRFIDLTMVNFTAGIIHPLKTKR